MLSHFMSIEKCHIVPDAWPVPRHMAVTKAGATFQKSILQI